MKKVIIILFIFIFMCQPVFARAGGGSSSSGGSSGHSSHTSSPHTSSRRQGGSPIAGVLGAGGCLMMLLYWKRHKAQKYSRMLLLRFGRVHGQQCQPVPFAGVYQPCGNVYGKYLLHNNRQRQ